MAIETTIGRFLQFMAQEKGASENTILAYRADLSQFHTFLSNAKLNGNPTDWWRIGKDTIVSYVLELKERRYAEASVARKVAAVKSFFQFLQAEGAIKRDPTESLQSPRVGKTLPRPLTVQQVDELLEQPAKRGTLESLRDQAMLELLYATGMRVTELVSLDLENISLDPEHPSARCMGKGAKERSVPVHEQALRALVAYLDDVRPKLVRRKKEPALFVNRRGDRLTRQGLWLNLKQYAKKAGIEGSVTPQSLRHSFAYHLIRNGAPLVNVRDLMGHANISTTQVYTQITDENIRRV